LPGLLLGVIFLHAPNMAKAKDDNHRLPEVTRQVFERRARRRLNEEEAREINSNLCGFFLVLRDWAEAEAAAQATAERTTHPTGK
jgi:hypothetical protein